LKLDKETTCTLKLYKGGANRSFPLIRLVPATNKQVHEAVRAFIGVDFSIYFREVSGIQLGEALVKLKRASRSIPKSIPILDWNATVAVPSSADRGKCPMCHHQEHKGGCLDSVRFDPKMSFEEKARIEGKRDEREIKRQERSEEGQVLLASVMAGMKFWP